jgi:hypothetical protein
MKTIASIRDLLRLQSDLTMFILTECPWMAEPWEAESIGYVFVLDDQDVQKVSSICTVPHIEENDREAMTIDLKTFDLWGGSGHPGLRNGLLECGGHTRTGIRLYPLSVIWICGIHTGTSPEAARDQGSEIGKDNQHPGSQPACVHKGTGFFLFL